MKYFAPALAFAGLGLLAACGEPAQIITVDCGDKLVTIDEGALTALRSDIGGDNAALAVAACEAVADVPAPADGQPIAATATSQSGSQFTLTVAGK